MNYRLDMYAYCGVHTPHGEGSKDDLLAKAHRIIEREKQRVCFVSYEGPMTWEIQDNGFFITDHNGILAMRRCR